MRADKRYFYSLDGIRGVAALLVAMRHLEAFFGPVNYLESYLAVDLFFVLSGVVLANAYEERLRGALTARHFMWVRVSRLYPLYILGSAISVIGISLGVVAGLKANQLVMVTLLAAFMLPNMAQSVSVSLYPLNMPAWSLFFELVANFLYARWIKVWTNQRLMLFTVLPAVCLATVVGFSKYHNLSVGFTIKGSPVALCRVTYSFFVGILLYRQFAAQCLGNVITGPRASIAVCAVLGCVSLILMSTPNPTWRPYFDFLTVIAAFPLITYAALWVQPSGMAARVCAFMGVISYPVYALHAPLGLFVQGTLDAQLIDYKKLAPAIGFAFMAFLVLVCWKLDSKYDVPFRRLLLAKTKYVVGLPPSREPDPV